MTIYCYWEKCNNSSIRLIVADQEFVKLSYGLDTLAVIYISEKYGITANFYEQDQPTNFEQTEYFPYSRKKDAINFIEKIAVNKGFEIIPKEMIILT